jgi:RNA polymerase sigma-70 factor (ECF subfamily)
MAVTEETSLLIDGAKNGDEEAVASLVDLYKDRLFRICLYFTKGEEAAEDLMQDVFLSIFRSLRSLKTNSYFETWMYKIVMNTHYQNIRRKNKRPVYYNDEVLLHRKSEAKTPDESMESDVQRDYLMKTVDRLPPKQREAVLLMYVEGLRRADIARMLDTNEETIKSRLRIARNKLRDWLNEPESPFRGD